MRARKSRRVFAVLAALLALAVLCGGCKGLNWPGGEPGESLPADYTAEYAGRWCYRCLTPRQQEMYAAVYRAVRECREDTPVSIRGKGGEEETFTGLKVKLPTPLTDAAEARRLYTAFTTDNPQFFYLGNTYSYEGYRLDGVDYYDVFCLTLTMEAAQRVRAASELERAADELLLAAADCRGDYEKELRLHDLLAAHVTYDAATAGSKDPSEKHPAAFTAYGALVEGRAVCEGYSRAMQYLLTRAGVPCTLVSGQSAQGESHMWNLVEVGGRGYHLDVTWDDADDRPHHTFFNLTTEETLLTHRPDEDNLGVDTCTATEANYYLHEGQYLLTYDRTEIAKAVAKQINAGSVSVDLRFSPETFVNARLFFSNSRLLAQYVAPFLQVEGGMWEYTCQANETYHTLTLCKATEKDGVAI